MAVKSGEQIMAERMMAEAKAKKTATAINNNSTPSNNIDYAAEIKRLKAQDPNANVNVLIDAGLAKVNADPNLKAKYGTAWDQLASQYRTIEQPVVAVSQNTGPSPNDYINQLNQARLNATLAQLGKSRDAAISNLNAEKASIQPKFYDARNQVAAGAQQTARNFAEYMAQRGGIRSGANAQATLAQNMSTQGNLGSLGRQETQAYSDIARRTTDVGNAYASDVASANAGIEADKMQALINQYNADRAYQLQLGGLTGNIGGQRTLAGQQFDYNVSPNNPQNQAQTIQNQISTLKLQALPQEIKMNLEAMEQDLATGKINQQQAEYQLNQLKDPNSIYNQSKILELEASKLGNQELRKRIAEIGKQPVTSQYEKDMQQIKLETAKAELAQLQSGGSGSTYKFNSSLANSLRQQHTTTNAMGQMQINNPQALRNAIIANATSEQEIDGLLSYFGLPTN